MTHRFKTTIAKAALLLALPLTTFATSTQAQNAHGIAAVVNDDIITTRDLRQRVLFMVATSGVKPTEETLAQMQRQAMRNLVDEHIQIQEAKKFDQTISDDEIRRAMGRMLQSNNVSPEEMQQSLARFGVGIGTFQDQIRSEVAWQRIVNGLYGSRIRISDAQIDETLNRLSAKADEPSYRVSEIYIEASPDIGGMEGAMEGANAMIAQVKQGAPFTVLAQQFSSAPTAAKGGDVGWVRGGELRPEIDAVITTMEKATLSDPIVVPGGVYVVALLDKEISESDTIYKLKQVNITATNDAELNAASERLDGLRASLTSCDTLKDDISALEDIETNDMGEVKASEITDDIQAALTGVGENQLSAPIKTPNGAVALMVCERRQTGSNIPTRDEIENRLLDQQLAQASRRHLRNLRRDATIVVR